jgi:hypothetical protein
MSEDKLVLSDSPIHPANLICELCRVFYGIMIFLQSNCKAMAGLQAQVEG